MDKTSPFAEIDRVFAEMDRRFEEMRRSLRASEWGDALPARGGPAGRDAAMDLHETDDGYVLYADLPGFDADDIDLSVDDGVLSLDAVHDVETEGFARSRRVHEHVTLPTSVDDDAVAATYRNGVLEVSLPAAVEDDDTRSIPIED